MKEKKASADWNIAATHWLTAGFAIPFILAIILGLPLTILLGKNNIFLLSVTMIIINFASVWLGVIYSSKYIEKTYIIKNANQIAILSTIFLVIIGGGFRIYKFLQNEVFQYEYIGFVVSIFIFYLASKKYIRND